MDATRSYRPRVSRETRLLLTTALVAAGALWVLARIRFPDLPAAPSPVSPLLSQLGPTPALDGLASEVFALRARLEPTLMVLDGRSLEPATGGRSASGVIALRVRDDLAIAIAQDAGSHAGTNTRVVGIDPPSGLVLVRVPAALSVPSMTQWTPREFDRPQVLIVTDDWAGRVTLRPVFVSSLEPEADARWPEPVWSVPKSSGIAVGSFVFTTVGHLVGVAAERDNGMAIVPSGILFAEVERLVTRSIAPAGDLGIRVQSLTPDLSLATGATVGVVVTWADQARHAGELVVAGDVIEAANGETVSTPDHWRVRLARLGSGEALTLRIRRHGQTQTLSLQMPPPSTPTARGSRLGLRLRGVPRVGAEVLDVEPGSVGARAGLATGDVITFIGESVSPTPGQVRAHFTSAPQKTPVVIGVTRGTTHLVTTLTR